MTLIILSAIAQIAGWLATLWLLAATSIFKGSDSEDFAPVVFIMFFLWPVYLITRGIAYLVLSLMRLL